MLPSGISRRGPSLENRDTGIVRSGNGWPFKGSIGAARLDERKSPLRSAAVGTLFTRVEPVWLYFHSWLRKKKSFCLSRFHFLGM